MIVTLRTMPRDDGQTSVVLTRRPASPDDPEVVKVAGCPREAMEWILEQVPLLTAQAGDAFRQYEGRYLIRADGSGSSTVTLDLDVPTGTRVVNL